MQVGDIVKSLDFNGVEDCYMVGQVVGVHFDGTFRARFIKRVWRGSQDRKFKTDYFTAPLQGNLVFDNDSMPRVTVVTSL